MKSTLALISDAAKNGAAALCQLFVDLPDAFIEAVQWLAPVDSERWRQPLTATIITAVSNHIGTVDCSLRLKACDVIVKAVVEGDAAESLEILSSLLFSMRPIDEDDAISSNEYIKNEQLIFHELKRCRWKGEKLVRILYFLRDISLDEHMVDAIITNFCSGIIDCDASSIPSACYNFIYLSEKIPEHSQAIMRAFVSSCETITSRSQTMPSESKISMLHAISTAIQSFGFSAKQDHQLGDVLLKLLKFRLVRFGSFSFALLLTLSDSNRHQKSITSFISNYALGSYRNKLSKSSSTFVAWVIHQLQKAGGNAADINDIGLYQDFDQILDNTVQNCESGWEFFIPNLVDLCFCLLDHYDKSCRSSHPLDTFNKRHINPKLLAVRAGMRSLLSIFCSYPASQTFIVERIFRCVFAQDYEAEPETSESPRSGQFSPAMVLLEQLMARNPLVFFEMASQIRNSFDHLMNMTSHQACQLIRILVPIITKRKELSNALAITIRKNMFSRHLQHRIMAVDIMLTLVHSVSGVQTSFTEMSQSSSSSCLPASADAHLFVEFKGLLHRVFLQQPQIRAHSYCCLQKCFQTGSPALRKHIFELLQKQLTSVLEPEQTEKLPFSMDLCIQSGTVIEPLPVLFYHFCQCVQLLKLSGSPTMKAMYEEGRKIIDPILEKLEQCNLEDFAFEKLDATNRSQLSSSVASAPDSIVRDCLRLSSSFWLEIHETAIDFLLMTNELDQATIEKVFKFNRTWEQLKPSATVRSTGKRKSSEKFVVKLPYFSIKSCNLVLGVLYGYSDGESNRTCPQPEVVAAIRDNPGFIHFCLSSACIDAELSFYAIRTILQRDVFLVSSCTIAPKLFKQCLRDLAAAKNQIQNGSPGRLPSGKFSRAVPPSLELLSSILDKVSFFGSDAVCDLYRSAALNELAIFEDRGELSPSDPLLFFESLEHLLNETTTERDIIFSNETSIILSMLSQCIPLFPERNTARLDWIRQIYRKNVSVPALSSNLLAYGFSLCSFSSSIKLLFQVAQDCVFAMGDIEEEIQPTATTELGFICEATIPAVIHRLLQLLESEFTSADWLLSIIKQVGPNIKDLVSVQVLEGTNQFNIERAQSCLDGICLLLRKSFEILLELLKIRSKDPNIFKSLASFLIRSFKFAVNVVVTLNSLKRYPSRRFLDMVSQAGLVSPAIYHLIKFNQESELGGHRQSKSATKKTIDGQKKLIPELTSQIEKFEHTCLRYAKPFKNIRISSLFKKGAAFDFRFSVAKALGEGASLEKKKKNKDEGKDVLKQQHERDDDALERDEIEYDRMEDEGSEQEENDCNVSEEKSSDHT